MEDDLKYSDNTLGETFLVGDLLSKIHVGIAWISVRGVEGCKVRKNSSNQK
jgi:hypothetical protein